MARILVVDDDMAVREVIKEVLHEQGHSCDMAADGGEALEAIRNTRFDLVILDRQMPAMDGIQTLTALRREPANKDLRVIMCTSANTVDAADEAFRVGANDYIVKPVDLQRLCDKVARNLKPKP
jgi:CheY-like chemotaxis protein